MFRCARESGKEMAVSVFLKGGLLITTLATTTDGTHRSSLNDRLSV